jgi:hypothetical protein
MFSRWCLALCAYYSRGLVAQASSPVPSPSGLLNSITLSSQDITLQGARPPLWWVQQQLFPGGLCPLQLASHWCFALRVLCSLQHCPPGFSPSKLETPEPLLSQAGSFRPEEDLDWLRGAWPLTRTARPGGAILHQIQVSTTATVHRWSLLALMLSQGGAPCVCQSRVSVPGSFPPRPCLGRGWNFWAPIKSGYVTQSSGKAGLPAGGLALYGLRTLQGATPPGTPPGNALPCWSQLDMEWLGP